MQYPITLIAAILYLSAVFLPLKPRWLLSAVIVLGWVMHGAVLWLEVSSPIGIRAGFALMLSGALWVSVFAYWVESWKLPLYALRLLILPSAAVFVSLPLFFPGQLVGIGDKSIWFPWHLGVAILAYGTLTVAAFHAVLMAMQEARLRSHAPHIDWLGSALDRLPALLLMERILFRLVFIGFILLSLTVLSGVLFSEAIFNAPLKWDHKTFFTLLSWLLFGILLAGRTWRGWRGKTALSLTLIGFVTLLLAYVGSRFVLEVILHRNGV